jgi:hypothetical protein
MVLRISHRGGWGSSGTFFIENNAVLKTLKLGSKITQIGFKNKKCKSVSISLKIDLPWR